MVHKIPRRMPATLDVIPYARPPGDLAWADCIACGEPLALHQPDPQAPDHLVGICEGCRRWHVIQLDAGGAEAMLIALPALDWFRAVLAAHDEPDAL